MSKKLLEVLPSLQSFKDNVISQLTNMFNGAEWLNDATSYTKQETIYRLLILKYGDRVIRYDDDNIFLNRLVFDLADLMPDVYAKQQVFIRNQLADYLSSVKNRAVIIDSETTNKRDSDSNSKLGNSSSPLNLIIDSAEQIQQAPITSSNLSNVKLVENYNGNNQQVNYNFVNDLVKTLNADYSLRLNEFMELLGKHFVNVVGSFYRPQQCNNQTVKDEPYRFNNGYVVNEVDYLGTQNKQAIDGFNEKLERLSDQVATKQNQLIAGDNITITNNVISAQLPQIDLSNYYTKQEVDNQQGVQDRFITTNSENIVKVNNKINEIINQLNNATLINYMGQWVAGTIAKLGEVWSFNDELYLCKVESTTTTPIEGTQWDLLSAPEIDLSNYYTKTQIDQTVNNINGNISDNRNDINNLDGEVNTLKNDLGGLGDIVNDNSSKINNKLDTSIFNNYQQSNDNKINELSTQQQINTNSINNMKWVQLTNIIRNNNRTTINLEGKRFIHLQGRFTRFTTNTGSWKNFTPFIIDTQFYNYPIRITLKDWNSQTIEASIQITISGDTMLLDAYDLNNNSTNYYLWGDVLGSN